MKLKDYLLLGFKNIKLYKLQSIIFVIVLTSMLLLGNVFLNFSYTVNTYYDNVAKYSVDARKGKVHKLVFTGKTYEKSAYSEVIEKVLEYNHVIYASNSDYNVVYSNIVLNNLSNPDRTIYLYPYIKTYPERLIYGRGVENNNEIICPRYLAVGENFKTKDDLTDMKEYLDKDIQLKFYRTIFQDKNHIYNATLDETRFKLVGIFENDPFDEYSYLSCYIEKNKAVQLYKETEIVYSEEYLKAFNMEISEGGRYTEFIVDTPENFKEVYKKLKEDGYDVNDGYFIDYNATNAMFNFAYILFFIAFILIIFTIGIYTSINLKKRRTDIALYKTFGYKNKDIGRILFMQLLILFLISFILNIIISLVGIVIGNNIISYYIELGGFYLTISFIREVLYFVVIMIVMYVVFKETCNSVNRLQIRNILKNDL